jgi:hypothetical protein
MVKSIFVLKILYAVLAMDVTSFSLPKKIRVVHSLLKLNCMFVQGDQKVFVHLMITVQKPRKNILNSFYHLP